MASYSVIIGLLFIHIFIIPRYSFYDGPPFATGLPHYGHILAGTIKDVVTRFAHQQGYYVERRYIFCLKKHK